MIKRYYTKTHNRKAKGLRTGQTVISQEVAELREAVKKAMAKEHTKVSDSLLTIAKACDDLEKRIEALEITIKSHNSSLVYLSKQVGFVVPKNKATKVRKSIKNKRG